MEFVVRSHPHGKPASAEAAVDPGMPGPMTPNIDAGA